MPDATINGTNIHYRLDGPEDAPPLLISNSLGTNLHMWDRQVADLTNSFRLVRYDSRGHGRSGTPDGAYSIEMLANDALGLLDHLDIEKACYCGLSKGGMIGQWMAAHAPERFHRMVFANTSAYMPRGATTWDERIKLVTDGGMMAAVDMITNIWFTEKFQAKDPDIVAEVRKMILATPPTGYCGCCRAIEAMDNRDTNKAISVPVMVIIGKHDVATPPDHGRALVEAIPGSRSVVLEGAHLSNIEDTPGFNKAVLDFLNAN